MRRMRAFANSAHIRIKKWLRELRQPAGRDRLPLIAAISVVVAILVVIVSSGSNTRVIVKKVDAIGPSNSGSAQHAPPHTSPVAPRRRAASKEPTHPRQLATVSSQLAPTKALGQLIIAPLRGGLTPSLLSGIKAGQVGGVVLFGSELSATTLSSEVSQMQAAARAGGNPGLLVMTDQEGGLIRRLAGPPTLSASEMSDPSMAADQGAATGQLLRGAGVNVDLAPVADVERASASFIASEHRSFGSDPRIVAAAACAFADGLTRSGIAYTLKHFPGLGDASASTDSGPVSITEPASLISADMAAYDRCGRGPLALVMVSSASYPALTGPTPAVLSPRIYRSVMPHDGIDAVTVSDALDTPALATVPSPAMQALNAGLDLLLYANTDTTTTYTTLSADLEGGQLSRSRVQQAGARVLALKRTLGLTP